ncbi:flavin reductase family protein [Pseudoleptotrichia goodfellowii]|jgi:Conserved protein/domain typically associated with flavoprotein oxygenases, DIM6/NTAB family|uniref:Flavin reductase like domain-containing protein n=1 Tax=Pseudoleptotrichia goodfellowii TaxID=157692 RepID=A0A510JD76_9FUSO|nr:flavin reductase [Pseudoleptotrichia goodfellowii]BBM36013.1 hypothetical protein JCM16774_0945 [Pseudoleptotrichia goodfellowii]
MEFHEIKIEDFNLNPFTSTKEWCLVTAGDEKGINTMTVTWGMMGYLWGGPVLSVYIRPERYTKKFVDEQKFFSLSFFSKEHRPALRTLGVKSGRDGDKIKEVDFHPVFLDGVPAFEEADLVIVAEKLYEDDIKPEKFLDESIPSKLYNNEGAHIVYTGRVKKIYVKG